jgi:hypothetical protein
LKQITFAVPRNLQVSPLALGSDITYCSILKYNMCSFTRERHCRFSKIAGGESKSLGFEAITVVPAASNLLKTNNKLFPLTPSACPKHPKLQSSMQHAKCNIRISKDNQNKWGIIIVSPTVHSKIHRYNRHHSLSQCQVPLYHSSVCSLRNVLYLSFW